MLSHAVFCCVFNVLFEFLCTFLVVGEVQSVAAFFEYPRFVYN